MTFVAALLALAPPVICIDPGHPSEVGIGTRGKKITEVALVWRVAKELKPLLEADGYRVVLTKGKEREYVRNRQRAEIANRSGAALLLRLHADAGHGSGFATFYPDRATRVQGTYGPSKEVLRQSAELAGPFHRAVVAELKGILPDAGVKTDRDTAVGRKQWALTGSVFSKVPVLLVEMCVLTNPKDEAAVTKPGGISRLASALRAGVRKAVPMANALSQPSLMGERRDE